MLKQIEISTKVVGTLEDTRPQTTRTNPQGALTPEGTLKRPHGCFPSLFRPDASQHTLEG